jgi:hypothetical protein
MMPYLIARPNVTTGQQEFLVEFTATVNPSDMNSPWGDCAFAAPDEWGQPVLLFSNESRRDFALEQLKTLGITAHYQFV